MKYILLFIYRILNVIISIICGIIIFLTFPIWPLFGYIFIGSDYFNIEPEKQTRKVWNVIHYPLYKFKEFIDNRDDVKFNFNKFWK